LAFVTERWERFVGWIGGEHHFGRAFVAILAPVGTIITLLLALGIIQKRDPLADSAAKTIEAGTSKVRLDVTIGGTAPVRYTAVGALDFRENRGYYTYNFTRTPGLETAAALDAQVFQNVVFMRVGRRLGSKRPWLLVDLDQPHPEGEPGSGGGNAFTELQIEDPTQVLDTMDAGGPVEDLGKVRELGVELRRYRGTLPSAGGRVTATAFIGDGDLVRKLELSSDRGRSRMIMRFYDFGVEVKTEVPPEDQVVTVDQLPAPDDEFGKGSG
jgi:hypothetical protein